jgi:hypothetical protein
MKSINQSILARPKAWLLLAATLLLATSLLAACSSGDQLLLAEFNRDGEAEIFLAGLGDDDSDWQSLAEDAEPFRMFSGQLATFVPDSNRIVLWYIDGDEIVVRHMEIGDDEPADVFDTDDNIFGFINDDPFIIYLLNSDECYASLDGGEAERLVRNGGCDFTENGAVTVETDGDETTVTVISLDGEDETVILDGVEDISRVRWNEDISTFAYVEQNRRDEQLFIIEAGDEEGEPLGGEFAVIESMDFLPDGKTVYAIARVDEDDDEVGLYINGEGEPLLEEDSIFMVGQSEDGEYVLFATSNTREQTIFVYSVDDQTVTEVTENDVVLGLAYANNDRLLLMVRDNDDYTILSAKADGTDSVELFSDDNYVIDRNYLDSETEQLFALMFDEDGLWSLFVTGLAEDGYFLLEEWGAIMLLNASDEALVFAGQEDLGDDWVLYSIPLEPDAKEIELDDDAEGGFREVFFSKNGRSLLYTATEDRITDSEVRQVPVDGSENPERLYKDMVLLDVNWDGQSTLEVVR